MFKCKIDEIFRELSNPFGIACDILIVGYDDDCKDYDKMLRPVMQIYRKGNLRCNKDNCHFLCMRVPFFNEIVSRNGVQPDHCKLCMPIDVPSTKKQKDIKSFLGIMNYFSKYSPATAEIYELLQTFDTGQSKMDLEQLVPGFI